MLTIMVNELNQYLCCHINHKIQLKVEFLTIFLFYMNHFYIYIYITIKFTKLNRKMTGILITATTYQVIKRKTII